MANTEDEKKHAKACLTALRWFLAEYIQYLDTYELPPDIGSPAHHDEIELMEDEMSPGYARDCGLLLINSGRQHLDSFEDSSRRGLEIAACTAIRACLEATALAAWLFAPDIRAFDRLERNYIILAYGDKQDEKLRNVLRDFGAKQGVPSSDFDARFRAHIEARSAVIEPLENYLKKHREPSGKLQELNFTKIINTTLNFETEYRFLSGIAHGNPWNLLRLHTSESRSEVKVGIPTSTPVSAAALAILGLNAFSQALLSCWTYFGWPLDDIELLIAAAFERANLICPPRLLERMGPPGARASS